MRKLKTTKTMTEDCPQKGTAGAPRAKLFFSEKVKEQFHDFVARVMKDLYSEEYKGYVIGEEIASRTEGAAMMFLVLTEKGWMNKDRTVRPFCDELTKCVTSLGYPSSVIPTRNHVGQKIDDYTQREQEKEVIVTGVLGEKNSSAHRNYYIFLHNFYKLLCEKL